MTDRERAQAVAEAMQQVYTTNGTACRAFRLITDNRGLTVLGRAPGWICGPVYDG